MKDEIVFTPFYSSFLRLCKRDRISPTEAAKRAGISSGAPTAWKNKGAIPRSEPLRKLCVLFSVDEDEMLGYKQKEKPTPVSESGLDAREAEFMELFRQLSEEQKLRQIEILKDIAGQRDM